MVEVSQEDIQAFFRTMHRAPIKVRVLLGLIVLIVVCVACGALFWVKDIERIVELDSQIETNLTQLKGQAEILKQKPELETKLLALKAELPRLQSALPDDRELPALLARLNDGILSNSLVLGEFRPLEAKDEEVLTVIPIALRIQGGAEAVARVPNLIAQFPRKVSLNEFDMVFVPEQKVWMLAGQMMTFAQLGVRLHKGATPAASGAAIGR